MKFRSMFARFPTKNTFRRPEKTPWIINKPKVTNENSYLRKNAGNNVSRSDLEHKKGGIVSPLKFQNRTSVDKGSLKGGFLYAKMQILLPVMQPGKKAPVNGALFSL